MGGIYVANKVADGPASSGRIVSMAELSPSEYNAALEDATGTAFDVTAAVLNAVQISGLAGTNAAPVTVSTADKKWDARYVKSTAATGDARALYLKQFFGGAGGGEVGRFYAVANATGVATGGTMNGIHATAEITTGGTISGQANAIRATVGTGAAITPGGTLAAITAETNFYAGSTLPATTYYMRFVSLGSTVQPTYVFSFEGLGTSALANAGTGANSAAVSTGGVAAKVLKIKVDGTDYWMPLFSSNS